MVALGVKASSDCNSDRAIVFLIGSLLLVPHIPVGLFGESDTELSSVSLELPPGSTLDDTDRAARQATDLL